MVETKSWKDFLPFFVKRWKKGEHVSIIGPTGSGKSHMALQLIKTRQYYVLLLTKGNDATLDKFIEKNDIELINKWPPTGFNDHIALWPRFVDIDSYAVQARTFRNAINGYRKGLKKIEGIYSEGVWSLLIDEVMYFKDELHLEPELKMLWTQGRSNNISLVAGTQRPFEVPQAMLNQWTHLFIFQTTDKNELDRIARASGNDSAIVRQIAPTLPQYHFLYVNRVTRDTIISKAER